MPNQDLQKEFEKFTPSFATPEGITFTPPKVQTATKSANFKTSTTKEFEKYTPTFDTEGIVDQTLNTQEEGFFQDIVSGGIQAFKSISTGMVGLTDPEKAALIQQSDLGGNPNVDDPGYIIGSIIGGIVPSALAIALAAPTGGASIAAVGALYGASAAGSARLNISNYEQKHGEVLTNGQEWAIALGTGIITAGIEYIGGSALEKAFSTIGKKTLLTLSDDVGKAFLQGKGTGKTIINALNKILPDTGQLVTGGLGEGLEEVFQQIGTNALEKLYNPDVNIGEGVYEAGLMGMAGGMLLGGTIGRMVGRNATMQDLMLAQKLEKAGYSQSTVRNAVATKQIQEELYGFDIGTIVEDKQALDRFVKTSDNTINLLQATGKNIENLSTEEIDNYATTLKQRYDVEDFFTVDQVKSMITSQNFAEFWRTQKKAIALNKIRKPGEKTQAQIELHKQQENDIKEAFNTTDDQAKMTSSVLDAIGLSGKFTIEKGGEVEEGSLLQIKEQPLSDFGFFSRMDDQLFSEMPNTIALDDITKWLNGRGVKLEEVEDSYLMDFIDNEKTRGVKSVSKENLRRWMKNNRPTFSVQIRTNDNGEELIEPDYKSFTLLDVTEAPNRNIFIDANKRADVIKEVEDGSYGDKVVNTVIYGLDYSSNPRFAEAIRDTPDGMIFLEIVRPNGTKYYKAQSVNASSLDPFIEGSIKEEVLEEITDELQTRAELYAEYLSQHTDFAKDTRWEEFTLSGGNSYKDYGEGYQETAIFSDSPIRPNVKNPKHFGPDGTFMHVRSKIYKDIDFDKSYFVGEEVQSDVHKLGSKGTYVKGNNEDVKKGGQEKLDIFEALSDKLKRQSITGEEITPEMRVLYLHKLFDTRSTVPDAPFKKSFVPLGLKYLMQQSVASGAEFFGLVTGESQVARNTRSLRTKNTEISWRKLSDTTLDYELQIKYKKNGETVTVEQRKMDLSALNNWIGDKKALEIAGSDAKTGTISEADLEATATPLLKMYNEYIKGKLEKLLKRVDPSLKLEKRVISTGVGRRSEVWSVPITENFKKNLPKILSYYQYKNGNVAGAMSVKANGDILLQGFQNANVDTGLHEIAHGARRILFDKNIPLSDRAGITDEMIDTVENWAGAKNGKWTTAAEEKFANGFVKYLRRGKAPVTRLQVLFDKLGKWLHKIYTRISGSDLDIKLSPEMIVVFDTLMQRGKVFVEPDVTQQVFKNVQGAEQAVDYAGLKLLERSIPTKVLEPLADTQARIQQTPEFKSKAKLQKLISQVYSWIEKYPKLFNHITDPIGNKATTSIRIFTAETTAPEVYKGVQKLLETIGTKAGTRKLITQIANQYKYEQVLDAYKNARTDIAEFQTLLQYFPEINAKVKNDFTEYVTDHKLQETGDVLMITDPVQVRSKKELQSDYIQANLIYNNMRIKDNLQQGLKNFFDFLSTQNPDMLEPMQALVQPNGTFVWEEEVLDKDGNVIIDPETEEPKTEQIVRSIEEVIIYGAKDIQLNKVAAQYGLYLSAVETLMKNTYTNYNPSQLVNVFDMTELVDRAGITIIPKTTLAQKIKEYEKRVEVGNRIAKKGGISGAGTFSVERNLRLAQMPQTGRAIARSYDVEMLYVQNGLRFVKDLVQDERFDEKYMQAYIFASEDATYLDSKADESEVRRFTEEEKARIEPIALKIREFFQAMDAENKAHGIYDKNFQEEKVSFYTNKILDLQERLDKYEQLKKPGKLARKNIEGIKNQIALLEQMKTGFKDGTYNYVPIPYIQYILERVRLDANFHKRTMSFLLSHKRSTTFIKDLFDAGELKADEVTIVDIIQAYSHSQGRDIAIATIKQAAIAEGGIKPLPPSGKEEPGYMKPSKKLQPAFKEMYDINNKKTEKVQVHIMLASTLMQQARVYEPSLYYRVVTTMKMWAFGRPSVMTIYDTLQSIIAGTNATNPKELIQAIKDVRDGTTANQWMRINGGNSSPLAVPSKRMIQSIRSSMKLKSNNEALLFLHSIAQDFKDMALNTAEDFKLLAETKGKEWTRINKEDKTKRTLGISTFADTMNILYHVTHDLAWSGDNVIRQVTFNKLLKKGHSPKEAGYLTSLIHGQYSDVPKGTRMQANKIFFTPTYKIVMTKWYTNMVKSVGTVLATPKKATATNYQLAMGLMRLLTVRWLIDYLLTERGFERKEYGRKYTITSPTPEGPKDFTLSLLGPHTLWDKYFNKIKRIIGNNDPIGESLIREFQGELTPFLRITRDVFLKNRSMDGQPIINRLDPYSKQKIDQASYMFKEAFQLFKPFYSDEPDPGKIKVEAKDKLIRDYGKLASWFIGQFAFVYYGQPEHEKTLRKLQSLESELRRDPNLQRVAKFQSLVTKLLMSE